MTKREQIASIMLEAAELLKNDTMNESAGRNGVYNRYVEERIGGKLGRNFNRGNKAREILANSKKLKEESDKYHSEAAKHKANANKLSNIISGSSRDYNKLARNEKKNAKALGKSAKEENERAQEYIKDGIDSARADREWLEQKSKKPNNSALHDKINKRASLKEAIDLLYEKAAEVDTMDEAVELIDKAEMLESLLED